MAVDVVVLVKNPSQNRGCPAGTSDIREVLEEDTFRDYLAILDEERGKIVEHSPT